MIILNTIDCFHIESRSCSKINGGSISFRYFPQPSDGSKAYVANYVAGLQIIDTTIDILYIVKNFIDSDIELKIYTNGPITRKSIF